MYRPFQPQFKIRIFDSKKANVEELKSADISRGSGYLDIEQCVAYPVTYEETSDMLSHLNFTVDKHAEVLLYYFHIGQTIQLFGGFYADNQHTMKHVFSGTVTRIRTQFKDTGDVSFSIECMHYGFTRMGKDPKNFVYPDAKSSRKFAQSDKLSVKEIIEGIAKDNNLEIGAIDLSSAARQVDFSKFSVVYQKDMTDWQFLTQLAQDFGCSVWIATENDREKLFFMSNEKAWQKQGDISFLFPLRNKGITEARESEMQRFSDHDYDRPRLLRELSIDEDISAADSVSRSAVYFDKSSGQYKEATSQIIEKEGKRYIYFYELQEDKVREIQDTNRELADEIRRNGPSALPWGDPNKPDPHCASYYYKEIVHYEEHEAVFDRAFFGITVSAKTQMDLAIRSQRTYRIRGILSYHSKGIESAYFLTGLKHIWDSDGMWTELEFKR